MSKKRKFTKRISLRALFVIVTVCCVVIGWYIVRSQNQRRSVQSIIQSGGGVMYNYRYNNGKYDPNAKPPGPQWLVDFLGVDFLDHVYGVDLSNKKLAEDPDLRGTTRIQALWIRNTNLDNLEFASHLTQLESLWIADTQITDLRPIANNKKLNWLGMERTPIQDLSPLYGLKDLRTLNISGTTITAEEIEKFKMQNPNCNVMGEKD